MSIASYEDISSIQLLLHNLDLLGFDPTHAGTTTTSNHTYENILNDTHLFTQHSDDITNHQAFECISYFLFQQMDATQTRTRFSSCWPIHDHSTSSRNYRLAAYQWLLELQDRDCLSKFPTLRRSYFDTCQGDAFTNILMSFSVLVLQTVIDRDLADPSGRPIRLTPSYSSSSNNNNNNDSLSPRQETKRDATFPDDSDPAEIEQQLQNAIAALAQYTYQQKNDFAAVVKKARNKAMALKEHMDDERSRQLSTSGHQSSKTSGTAPDLTKIRDQIAALRNTQQRKLQKIQQEQQESDRSWTPTEETILKHANEFEQMQALLLNNDDGDVDRATQHSQHSFTLPSLLPSVNVDSAEAIKRIQDLIQLHIQQK